MSEYIKPRIRARFFVPLIASLLATLLVFTGFNTPAFAAEESVKPGAEGVSSLTIIGFPESGGDFNGTPTFKEGSAYKFSVGYDEVEPGQVMTFAPPAGLSVSKSSLVVPAGNEAVKSLELLDDGSVRITFVDEIDPEFAQGVLEFEFTVDERLDSEFKDVSWMLDGNPSDPVRIVFLEEDDNPGFVAEGRDKRAANGSWNPHVTISFAADDKNREHGKVSVGKESLNDTMTYTYTVNSVDGGEITFTDTLDDENFMFDGKLTVASEVRDEKGLNAKKTDAVNAKTISGQSFTHTFTAEKNSTYTFSYQVKIAGEAARLALEKKLQAAYDEGIDGVDGGAFAFPVKNTVTEGSKETASATVQVQGYLDGMERPGYGEAFRKTVDVDKKKFDEILAAGSALPSSIPVTYTMTADLTKFASFAGTAVSLQRNVVMTDKLPAEAEWLAADPEFLTLTVDGQAAKLTPVDRATVTNEEFKADKYALHYILDGRTLMVNFGQDVTKSYALKVKAQLNELTDQKSSGSLYDDTYTIRNWAMYEHSVRKGDQPHWTNADTNITVDIDTSGGVTDDKMFKKSTNATEIKAKPGHSIKVNYGFEIGKDFKSTGKDLPIATQSRIVDKIDHSVFNVTDATLPAIKESINGVYGSVKLTGEHFDLSIDADGNLIIAPNAAFATAVKDTYADTTYQDKWSVHFDLVTHVFDGKETKFLSNSADYLGEGQEITFKSSWDVQSTSYGDELSLRKQVFNAETGNYSSNVRAALDADGKLVNNEYIYRVTLNAHGKYNKVFKEIVDTLPAGVEFVEFLNTDHQVAGTPTSVNLIDSDLTASYEDGKVTIKTGPISQKQTPTLLFKVKVNDFTPNVAIKNKMAGSTATITPTNGYPLSLFKQDSVDPDNVLNDDDARFSLLAADKKTVVFGDLRLVDGVIESADGTSVVVDAIGTYWLREDVAPKGYILAKDLVEVTVDAQGTSEAATLWNKPALQLDLKKVDADDASKTISDDYARFSLFGADPKDSSKKVQLFTDLKLVDGNIVQADGSPATVDAVGTYWLREDVAPKGYILERQLHEFVVDDISVSPVVEFANKAGKTYAIGDFVWIDANKDGKQDGPESDHPEEVLPGVRVDLYQDGEIIASTVTNENGLYIFDQLPAGEYEVKFTLTDAQKKTYGFTKERAAGSTHENDSNANTKTGFSGKIVLDDSNTYLTKDYLFGDVLASEGIDPTWDAGVIVLDDDNTSKPTDPEPSKPTDPDPSKPTDPAHPGNPIVNALPNTGGTSPLLFAGIAGLLIAAGGALAFWRRRSAKSAI